MELQVIAHARNGFTDKFGIPRQSREQSILETRIVFTPPYRVAESLRGIEGFSHLWLLWSFSENVDATWTPTVRPPRLGGNRRVGVFATRSPFRPNGIGLSCVRLVRVEKTKEEGAVLVVRGADLMDGTPIYDIKPYLPYTDSRPEATNGFAEKGLERGGLAVRGLEHSGIDEPLRTELEEILRQDPRPGYQHDPERVYGLDYGGWNVQFTVDAETVWVREIHPVSKQ